eukprot:998586-Rhodomonas_salina.1
MPVRGFRAPESAVDAARPCWGVADANAVARPGSETQSWLQMQLCRGGEGWVFTAYQNEVRPVMGLWRTGEKREKGDCMTCRGCFVEAFNTTVAPCHHPEVVGTPSA